MVRPRPCTHDYNRKQYQLYRPFCDGGAPYTELVGHSTLSVRPSVTSTSRLIASDGPSIHQKIAPALLAPAAVARPYSVDINDDCVHSRLVIHGTRRHSMSGTSQLN